MWDFSEWHLRMFFNRVDPRSAKEQPLKPAISDASLARSRNDFAHIHTQTQTKGRGTNLGGPTENNWSGR